MKLRKLFTRTDAPEGEWATPMSGRVPISRGAVTLYLSHGAGSMPGNPDPREREHADTFGFVDWFIVEPRDDPERQVESLRRAGRTVVAVTVEPWNGEDHYAR